MTTASPSLIGYGSALLDIIAFVSEQELKGLITGIKGGTELVDIDTMASLLERLPNTPKRVPGGAAANTIYGYAKLGGKAALLGKVGDDDDGACYIEGMRRDGIDTSPIKIGGECPTGKCLSLITPDSERTMRTYMGANATLKSEDLTADDFKGHTHLFLEGYTFYNPELAIRILDLAKQENLTICIDLNSLEIVLNNKDILPTILRDYVDAIFANELEAAAFADTEDELEALDAFAELCPIAVVKVGKRGAYIKENNSTLHRIDACIVQALDTTGAGDLWAAGFMYGWLNGQPIPEAGRLGARVAAKIVQVPGARLGEAAWARLAKQ